MYEYRTSVTTISSYETSGAYMLNTPDHRPWRLRESKIVETCRLRNIPGTTVPMPGSYSSGITETETPSYSVVAVWELYKGENE